MRLLRLDPRYARFVHDVLCCFLFSLLLVAAGIGPKRALELIRKHGSLEAILANLDKQKYPVPEAFPVDEGVCGLVFVLSVGRLFDAICDAMCVCVCMFVRCSPTAVCEAGRHTRRST